MICETPSPEIINACRVLFSRSTPIDANFLNAIAFHDLKDAFRKRAMETHPDRARALGRDRDALSRMFREVVSAYDVLKTLVDVATPLNTSSGGTTAGSEFRSTAAGRKPPKRPRQKASGAGADTRNGFYWQKTARSNTGAGARRDHHFKGVFPARELRIGEFLYYSGRISWKTLIDAIIWQRQQRPRVGEIAIGWNILTMADVLQIIQNKSYTERFCEYALNNGFFTPFQHLAVISRQKQLQPRFGEHFVQNGFFTKAYLEAIVCDLQQHNVCIRKR